MAVCRATLVFITLVVSSCSLLWAGEAATDCTAALTGLVGCSTFLTNTSSTPDQKSCCAPLETVLSTPSSFQCLCAQAATGSNSQAYKNAILLPAACKLKINVSQANCTGSSSSSNSTSTSTQSTKGNSGVRTAVAMPFVLAMALLWPFLSWLA